MFHKLWINDETVGDSPEIIIKPCLACLLRVKCQILASPPDELRTLVAHITSRNPNISSLWFRVTKELSTAHLLWATLFTCFQMHPDNFLTSSFKLFMSKIRRYACGSEWDKWTFLQWLEVMTSNIWISWCDLGHQSWKLT